MIETRVRGRIEPFLDPIGRALAKVGLTPTALTLIGLVVTVGAGVLIARGHVALGGVIFLLGSALDGLDGTVARVTGQATRRGALIDSVADRIGETAVWGGLAFWLADTPRLVMAVIFCLAGAMLMPYLRAKAEAVGAEGSGGLFGRGERVLVLGLGLLTGFLEPFIWFLLVVIWISVAQRFWAIWKRLDD